MTISADSAAWFQARRLWSELFDVSYCLQINEALLIKVICLFCQFSAIFWIIFYGNMFRWPLMKDSWLFKARDIFHLNRVIVILMKQYWMVLLSITLYSSYAKRVSQTISTVLDSFIWKQRENAAKNSCILNLKPHYLGLNKLVNARGKSNNSFIEQENITK